MTRAREPPFTAVSRQDISHALPCVWHRRTAGRKEGKMTYQEKRDFVRQSIKFAALYEQLAEECAELAQAALKMARIMRGDNPTPVRHDDAGMAVEEEYTDVELCASLLRLKYNPYIATEKLDRWVERIKEKEEE